MKKKTKQHKKYFLNVIEEAVLNPDFFGYRGGRIEVYDDSSPYAIYEARFLIPEELANDFREVFDFKEVDKLPYIRFDYEGEVLRTCKNKKKN